jgi:hypothetical protein
VGDGGFFVVGFVYVVCIPLLYGYLVLVYVVCILLRMSILFVSSNRQIVVVKVVVKKGGRYHGPQL